MLDLSCNGFIGEMFVNTTLDEGFTYFFSKLLLSIAVRSGIQNYQ